MNNQHLPLHIIIYLTEGNWVNFRDTTLADLKNIYNLDDDWINAVSQKLEITREDYLDNIDKLYIEFRGIKVRTYKDLFKTTFLNIDLLYHDLLESLEMLHKGENPIYQFQESVEFLEKCLTYNGIQYPFIFKLCVRLRIIGFNRVVKRLLTECESPIEFHEDLETLSNFINNKQISKPLSNSLLESLRTSAMQNIISNI